MDDFTRLEQKLAKLRQRDRTPGEARMLRGAPDRLITGILTEIDETILPRRLTFATEGGESLHFAVANRRLQAMVGPAPSVDGADKVANVELMSVEDEAVGQLKSVLDAVISKSEALTVTSARFKDYSPPSDVGVPIDQLAKAWGLDDFGDGAGGKSGGIDGFIKGLNGRAEGWLRIDGEEVAGQGGAEETIAALVEGAAVFLDGYLSKKDDLSDGNGGPLGLVFSAANGASIVFVDAGESMVFVRADDHEAYLIANDWQQMVAL